MKRFLFVLLLLTSNIYSETINVHTLPPEPDPLINNSTLLGIDSNNNGVRDDVERWIYKTYKHPIEIGIFMQSSRAYNMVIADPSKAKETRNHISNIVGCIGYWKYYSKENNETYILDPFRDTSSEINKIQFNTSKRHMAYERFNEELSGGVYGSSGMSKEKCEFDENGILTALKDK